MQLARAKNLWIQAGAMSGPPAHRHQIEFSNSLAQFFRQVERDGEIVLIQVGKRGAFWPRPLTYRGTDYGQWSEQWRLGLPTPAMRGPVYSGRVIRLERLRQGGNVYYRLHVTDSGSPDAATWLANSGVNTDVTPGPGGRDYGWW